MSWTFYGYHCIRYERKKGVAPTGLHLALRINPGLTPWETVPIHG